jgi:hypothetical protein
VLLKQQLLLCSSVSSYSLNPPIAPRFPPLCFGWPRLLLLLLLVAALLQLLHLLLVLLLQLAL